MSRTSRQAKILELISVIEIETQEDFVSELLTHGLNATQATISRDIKELGLIKVLTDKNTYKYAAVNAADNKLPQKFINVFREAVIALTVVNNLLLVKTLPGGASAVAMVVDQINSPEMLGNIAGDDTVLLVARTEKDAEALKIRLNSML